MSRWVVLKRRVGAVTSQRVLEVLFYVNITLGVCYFFTLEFPLQPLALMNRSFVGGIYGRSFIKMAHFVQIGKQTWPPWEILQIFVEEILM
jgi:hypothetical protein